MGQTVSHHAPSTSNTSTPPSLLSSPSDRRHSTGAKPSLASSADDDNDDNVSASPRTPQSPLIRHASCPNGAGAGAARRNPDLSRPSASAHGVPTPLSLPPASLLFDSSLSPSPPPPLPPPSQQLPSSSSSSVPAARASPVSPPSRYPAEPTPIPASVPTPTCAPDAPDAPAYNHRLRVAHGPSSVPIVFEWRGGGNTVHVTGSWDKHTTHLPLDHNGDEHIALAYLQPGDYHFCFVVDGILRHSPLLPCVPAADGCGRIVNSLIVRPVRREYDTSDLLLDREPSSPMQSYGTPAVPDFVVADPPSLPPYLEARALKPLPDDISPLVAAQAGAPSFSSVASLLGAAATAATATARVADGEREAGLIVAPSTPKMPCPAAAGIDPTAFPYVSQRPFFSHVFIDHLYEGRRLATGGNGACGGRSRLAFDDDGGDDDDGVQVLSQTFRFGDKVINTVFVTNRLAKSPDGRAACDLDMPP